MEHVALILKRVDESGLPSALKSKAINICVNLSIGTQVQHIIQPKYGVLDCVSRMLDRGIKEDDDADLLENCLWLLSNLVLDCTFICHKVIEETSLLECLVSQSEQP